MIGKIFALIGVILCLTGFTTQTENTPPANENVSCNNLPSIESQLQKRGFSLGGPYFIKECKTGDCYSITAAGAGMPLPMLKVKCTNIGERDLIIVP